MNHLKRALWVLSLILCGYLIAPKLTRVTIERVNDAIVFGDRADGGMGVPKRYAHYAEYHKIEEAAGGIGEKRKVVSGKGERI